MTYLKLTKSISLTLGILATFNPAKLFADELKWTHFGARPLGMGNAFVAVADDYNALFYNPAGLARIKEWDGEFLNPRLEVAQSTISFAGELMELSGGDKKSTTDILDIFQKHAGKVDFIGLSLTPHLIFKNFGFGLGLEVFHGMAIHSDIDIAVDSGVQATLPISYAQSFMQDKLSLGATFKMLAKGGVKENFNIQTLSAFTSKKSDDTATDSTEKKTELTDLLHGGYGYGADIGLLFTPVKPMEPTLGISIADIGGSSYEKANVSGKSVRAPETRLPAVNTGISLKPIQSGRSYVLTAIDMHAINQPSHFSNKLNLGVEWGYGDIIKVQAGTKSGYYTAGFQFDVGLLNIRASTYAIEHSPVVGTHDDLIGRRYLLQFKLLI